MAKQLRPLPVIESITVENTCPVCGEANWFSLKDLEVFGQYECQQCHAGVPLSSQEARELRDRIMDKFSELIRLG